MSSNEQQPKQPTEQEAPVQRSHKCSSCNCTKQQFYERGPMLQMRNATGTYVIEYSGYECASCGFLMPFKTAETAQGMRHTSTS